MVAELLLKNISLKYVRRVRLLEFLEGDRAGDGTHDNGERKDGHCASRVHGDR